MDNIKHYKHAKLERRMTDNFAPNEIAVLGSKCSIIADFVQKMSKKLQKKAKIAYFDASHSDSLEAPLFDNYTAHHSGNFSATTRHLLNEYNERIRFNDYDLLFINGNHYKGAKQILILDNEKEASVKKRLDQLDRIQFVVKLRDDSNYFDFLVDEYPAIKNLKSYHIDEVDTIANHVYNLVQETIAPINGLVLAGGKSKRMGQDKTQINYHGKSQLAHTVEQLENNLLNTFVSLAEDQDLDQYQVIQDKFVGLGVFGAICSAFMKDPNKAWLALATDLPFVNNDLIKELLKRRNPSKVATAVKGKSKQFVEPIITIYEPKAYPLLLSYLSQGYSCPRKALINSDVEIVEVDDDMIRNVNTPQEYEEAIKEISQKA
ncbi:MAG: NTP transferase domain-containing protein [Flavobacteriaceae bacterium]|nr:NTP transferase domain-containing protein [Flavobacteriaceae bacterium]